MSFFFKKYAPIKNNMNKLTNMNWKLKKFATGALYKISANSPQNNISYALKKERNATATIRVIHHGKNSKLENFKALKIILK